MEATEQSFLVGLGIAVATDIPSAPIPADDNPAPWTEPERGGFPDGFAATVSELHDVEQRLDQGGAVIAEKKAAKQPVPATWLIRLQSLTTKRLGLRKDLTDRYPKALNASADLVARLTRQEDWFRTHREDSRYDGREEVYLHTLAAYERLAEAIDRAFVTVTEETGDDPDAASWTRGWQELRALGFAEKQEVEKAISGWDGADPQGVVRRAKEARPAPAQRRFMPPSRSSVQPVREAPIGAQLACYGCGGPREMGIPCAKCGAMPVVARKDEHRDAMAEAPA